MGWYLFALAALILIGFQRFLYKVSAAKGCSTALTTFSFMGTVAVLSSAIYITLRQDIPSLQLLILLALLNSLSFFTATMAHIQSLKFLPSSVVYPIIRLNIVLVVLFSVFFLNEQLSLSQWMGIVLAAGAMFLLARYHDKQEIQSFQASKGLWLVMLAMLAGALASISCKFAAEYTNKLPFIALSYLMSTFFSLSFYPWMFPSGQSRANAHLAIIIGFSMGVINLAGFYAFLQALALGPLALVASIIGMHFVVAVILSVAIFKDRINSAIFLGIAMTLLSLILIRGPF